MDKYPREWLQDLRRKTGAPLVECTAALTLARGVRDAAERLLRAQGTMHGFPHSLRTEARIKLRMPGQEVKSG